MKIDHINEFTLNEYLDDALPETERRAVESHLTTCASCQAELAELQQLFFMLDSVAEASFTVDVATAVAAQIEQESVNSKQWTVNSGVLLVLEIIAAGVLLFLLWPTVQKWLLPLGSWQAQFMADMIWPTPISWVDMSERVTATSTGSVQAVFDQLQSAPPLDLATIQWAVLLGAALVIWLAGNRLLFTNNPPPQNGGSHG